MLGAIIVGAGTGYFLYLANQDRQLLAEEANRAKLEAQTALQNSQQAIEEANNKLFQANQEVEKAQSALQYLMYERSLLAIAEPLSINQSEIDNWETVINSYLELSLIVPPNSTTTANNDKLLSINSTETTNSKPNWLEITSYQEKLAEDLLARISSTTDSAYFVDGKLISGKTGTVKNSIDNQSASIYVVYNNGTSTHLIWMTEPPSYKNKNRGNLIRVSQKQILSTLKFKKP
jgi:uncharacterized coiled-coil protein SlyX